MAALTTQSITLAGLNPTFTAVSASDTFDPGDRTYLHVTNGGGSPDTVAIVTPATSRGLAISDAGGSCTNGQSRIYGPFPADLFADPSTSKVTVTHSFTTSVTCAVITLPAL